MTNKPTDHEIDVFVQVCREKGMRELDVFQAVLARWDQQAAQDAVGEVVWAAGVPNSIREVHLKKWDLPIGTKLYTSPQPEHSGEPVAWMRDWDVYDPTNSGPELSHTKKERSKGWVPLYTAPPPVEQEPLKVKEIAEFVGTHEFGPEQLKWFRLGEAAHGIEKGGLAWR